MRGSFLYVGQAIAANLSSAERKLMTDFFARMILVHLRALRPTAHIAFTHA